MIPQLREGLALQTAGMPGQNGMQHRSTWKSEQGSVYVHDVEGRWVDKLRLHDLDGRRVQDELVLARSQLLVPLPGLSNIQHVGQRQCAISTL
jgi:hypothetical protein